MVEAKQRPVYAGPTESVPKPLWFLAQPAQRLWAQRRRLLGEMCPWAPLCFCVRDGGGVMEAGFPVRSRFRFHHSFASCAVSPGQVNFVSPWAMGTITVSPS